MYFEKYRSFICNQCRLYRSTHNHTYICVYILLSTCSVRHHLFSWLIINYSGTITYWLHNLTKICNSLILFWQSYSFRRGTYPSTIFSLSFAPSMQLPDILVGTSSSGSVHAFSLGFFGYQRWEIHLHIPFGITHDANFTT